MVKRPLRKAWRTSTKQADARGYGWQHTKNRKRLLTDEPTCRECRKNGRITAAKIADHIIPLSKGGSREADNLQPLCVPCHTAKTAKECRR
jgi:5-methylcytosine-specific restriction protein A